LPANIRLGHEIGFGRKIGNSTAMVCMKTSSKAVKEGPHLKIIARL
jgi:hypothetical protein